MIARAENEGDFGAYVQGLRTARGMSARQVAAAARLAPSTLTRWEKSQTLPRVPELQAVLDALAATPEQGAYALGLLRAPRAARHARRSDAVPAVPKTAGANDVVAPCASGDLLRALRLRASRTQADVAQAVGVSAALVGAWERSEKWPSAGHLHALCWGLGASEDEVAVLTTAGAGLWASSPPGGVGRAETPREIRSAARCHLSQLIQSSWPDSSAALADLLYLGLQGALWSLAARDDEARVLLAEVCAWRSLRLAQSERYAEAIPVAARSLALLPDPRRPPWFAAYAVISLAQSVVYRGVEQRKRPQAEKGLRILQRWFPRDAATVLAHWDFTDSFASILVYASWIESDRATYLAYAGRTDAGRAASAVAVEKAERADDNGAFLKRRMEEMRLLVQSGLWDEALVRAKRMPPRNAAAGEADFAVLEARALFGAGARHDAASRLADAYTVIASEPAPYWQNKIRARVDAVARFL